MRCTLSIAIYLRGCVNLSFVMMSLQYDTILNILKCHNYYCSEKIQKGKDWKNVSYLDTVLNEAVQVIPTKQSFSV